MTASLSLNCGIIEATDSKTRKLHPEPSTLKSIGQAGSGKQRHQMARSLVCMECDMSGLTLVPLQSGRFINSIFCLNVYFPLPRERCETSPYTIPRPSVPT